MKGLKKIALASAVAAVSAGAQAELKALDDSAMGELTGQAGLTIDLETKYTIGEFMYKDAGSVFLTGIELQANENDVAAFGALAGAGNQGFVDNIRIKLDIAGDGTTDKVPAALGGYGDNVLDVGFSRVQSLAAIQASAAGAAKNKETGKFLEAASGSATLTTAAKAAGLADNATAYSAYDSEGYATAGATEVTTANITSKKAYDDGDLVIHVSFKDAWQKSYAGGLAGLLADGALGGLAYDDVLGNGLKSVDFSFSIDAIGIAGSGVDAGDTIGAADVQSYRANGTTDATGVAAEEVTTVLISDLDINGYLGPVDIHIENDGNGFGLDTDGDGTNDLTGSGNADSVINWNTYVNVTDLSVYLDIAGVYIDDMKINNVRGDVTDIDGNFAFGFAQSKREIYAVRNTAGINSGKLAVAVGLLDPTTGAAGTPANPNLGDLGTALNAVGDDGIAINTHFKGDMEIGHLSFGDTGTSIGELYWTDINSQTNWTISAH